MLETITSYIDKIPDKPFLTFYYEYVLDTLDNLVSVEAARLCNVSNLNDIESAINSLVEEVTTC